MFPRGKQKLILKIAAAFAIVLWSGLIGALAGLGCSCAFPARYRTTGRVVLSAGDNPVHPLQRAAAMAVFAKSTATLSTAILVADLYHGERDRISLNELANRLAVTAQVRPAMNGAFVDLTMTSPDRDKVQRALDSVIRHMMADETANQPLRVGAFAMDSRNASTPVRDGGIEPGTGVLGGLIAGLLLHAVFTQFQLASHRRTARA